MLKSVSPRAFCTMKSRNSDEIRLLDQLPMYMTSGHMSRRNPLRSICHYREIRQFHISISRLHDTTKRLQN